MITARINVAGLPKITLDPKGFSVRALTKGSSFRSPRAITHAKTLKIPTTWLLCKISNMHTRPDFNLTIA